MLLITQLFCFAQTTGLLYLSSIGIQIHWLVYVLVLYKLILLLFGDKTTPFVATTRLFGCTLFDMLLLVIAHHYREWQWSYLSALNIFSIVFNIVHLAELCDRLFTTIDTRDD
jgi:hypothetical protein